MADKEYTGGNPVDSGSITQEEIYKFKDRVQQLEYAAVPVGSVVPYVGGTFTNGSNAGFSAIGGNASLAQVKALVEGQTNGKWTVCDGSLISNADSPWDGLYVPNLTDDRFIEGFTSMGTVGGQNSINFCHRHSGNLPAHDHCMAHTHTVLSHYHNMAHNHGWACKTGSFVTGSGLTEKLFSNRNINALNAGIITNECNRIISHPFETGFNGPYQTFWGAMSNNDSFSNSFNMDGIYYTTGVAGNAGACFGTNARTGTSSPGTGTSSLTSTCNSGAVAFNTGYTQGDTDIRPKYLTSFYLIRVA